MKRALALLVAAVALCGAAPALADEALDARLKSLETELRCLVCQNQTLAESNASLAEDLRKEVRELATSGKSNEEIKQYLVARYGDFVLYRPPVKPETYLLWFGPFLLLAGGALVWLAVLRRRARMERDASPAEDASIAADARDVARARALLDDSGR